MSPNPDEDSDKTDKNAQAFLVAYTPEAAPSEGHEQVRKAMQMLAEECDIEIAGSFSTLDEEKFRRIHRSVSEEWPSPDFEGDTNE